jgi:hypothetical protein
VDNSSQLLWRSQIAFNERAIDDQLGSVARKLLRPSLLSLPPHGLEVVLHAVNADPQAARQGKVSSSFRPAQA